MKALTKSYIVFFITSSITLLGFWLYEWDLSGILFYMFLFQILKLPNTILTYRKLKNSELGSVLAFGVVQVFLLVFYGLFMVYLINNTSQSSVLDYLSLNEFSFGQSAFERHFSNLTAFYALPLLGIVLIEILAGVQIRKKMQPHVEKASK